MMVRALIACTAFTASLLPLQCAGEPPVVLSGALVESWLSGDSSGRLEAGHFEDFIAGTTPSTRRSEEFKILFYPVLSEQNSPLDEALLASHSEIQPVGTSDLAIIEVSQLLSKILHDDDCPARLRIACKLGLSANVSVRALALTGVVSSNYLANHDSKDSTGGTFADVAKLHDSIRKALLTKKQGTLAAIFHLRVLLAKNNSALAETSKPSDIHLDITKSLSASTQKFLEPPFRMPKSLPHVEFVSTVNLNDAVVGELNDVQLTFNSEKLLTSFWMGRSSSFSRKSWENFYLELLADALKYGHENGESLGDEQKANFSKLAMQGMATDDLSLAARCLTYYADMRRLFGDQVSTLNDDLVREIGLAYADHPYVFGQLVFDPGVVIDRINSKIRQRFSQ